MKRSIAAALIAAVLATSPTAVVAAEREPAPTEQTERAGRCWGSTRSYGYRGWCAWDGRRDDTGSRGLFSIFGSCLRDLATYDGPVIVVIAGPLRHAGGTRASIARCPNGYAPTGAWWFIRAGGR